MKIYILLMLLLLFTSCVSNKSRTEMSMRNSITVKEQGIEFKKLQAENIKLREDMENLNKRIQEIKGFYELN